jgi:hypothetical protein
MRIHPIFYIFLLESADPHTSADPIPEIYSDLLEEVYTIEKVLKIRKYRKALQ